MNITSKYVLTIIVPIYNEEENMQALEEKLSAYLEHAIVPSCVLFVNDGSSDGSLDKIAGMCKRHSDFFYCSLARNGGLSAALKAGIDETSSRLVGYIDADLQTNPEDFNLLLPFADQYQLVMGIRANRKDSLFKKAQSKIANGFRRMMTHDHATDTGCPLKVMHTSYAKRIPFFTGMHRFLPAMIQLQQGKVKEMPVRHYPRVAGVSKYHLWNRLVSPLIDCFDYCWMKSRYINYEIDKTNLQDNNG